MATENMSGRSEETVTSYSERPIPVLWRWTIAQGALVVEPLGMSLTGEIQDDTAKPTVEEGMHIKQ